MSITASEMTPADIAAVTNGGNNDGFGDGNGAWWLIVLFLFAMGGWGNNGFGGNMGGGTGYVIGDVQRGFDQSAVMAGINGLTSDMCNGFSNVQQSLCNGFAGVNQTVQNGFSQAEIANNSRQMANMNQMFGLQSQLADCCCENRLGTADLKYTIATENCADRQALNEGVRDIIASQTAGTQRILDQLCSDKIDAKNDEIAQLRQEVLFARGQASQVNQNSDIINGVYNRLNECPVGTVPVYGEQPIFQCNSGCNSGCGCGM